MNRAYYLFVLAFILAGAIGCSLLLSKKPADDFDAAEDSNMTAKVKAKLANDAALNLFRIDVETRRGVVALNGNVPTEDRKERAGNLAASVEGVKGVENFLQVGERGSRRSFDDAVITSKIVAELIRQPLTHSLSIDVETDGGAVTLEGRVKSENEKKEAERIARNTEGVVSVENKLKIPAD
ncbi:MAG TPA: BON domain-containing protein [Candidatus Manganitrophaceae bacterium]|nr:BON domain-containing protein [Candidatus Manganitrophaceae bacterium]